MSYLGDWTEDSTHDFKFTTRDTTGVPTTLGGTPALSVYKANGTTQSTAGITLTTDFDSVTGLNHVRIDTSADAFYAVGNDYDVVITTGTVDGTSVVGEVIGSFSIENRFQEVDVVKFGGTAGTFSGGRPEVNVSHWAGVATATNDVALATAPTNFASLAITAAGGVTLGDGVTHGGSTADFEARDISVAGTTNFVGAFVADNAGNQIKGIDSFTTAGKAEIQQEATDALNAYDPPTKAEMDTGLDALPTALENADAVWDEDATAHQTQGTFGQAIGDPGADSDSIWALANTNLDAAVSSRASQASVDTIDGIVDAILLDTAEIGAAGAGLTEAGGTGDQFTAIPWNAAWDAEVQSECTDALNAYDPPTKAETDALLTTAMTEAYPTDGSTMTVAQALYLILANVAEFAISGTTITVKKLDGSTTAATYTLDDATNPTSRTRAT